MSYKTREGVESARDEWVQRPTATVGVRLCQGRRGGPMPMSASRSRELGDALTGPALVGARCNPVRRADGRCVVSTRMAMALVEFEGGRCAIVKRRRLRLMKKERRVDGGTRAEPVLPHGLTNA